MIRINENLMEASTIDWTETTVIDGNNTAVFSSRYYQLMKPPVSGILSISADVEFITQAPKNISSVVRVKDFADSSWRFIAAKSIPYTAGHRTKFEGLFDTGQVYVVEVGIYVGESGKTGGNKARIRKVKVENGSECTMWIPPESTLTEAQRSTLPPYGEYKEILPL